MSEEQIRWHWDYPQLTANTEEILHNIAAQALIDGAPAHLALAHTVLDSWQRLVGPAANTADQCRLKKIVDELAQRDPHPRVVLSTDHEA